MRTSVAIRSNIEVRKLEWQLEQRAAEEALQDMFRSRWFIIRVGNMYKFSWQIFIIMLAVYNALALPLQIAFIEVQDYYDTTLSLEILEILVDVFFILDMVVIFFSAYIDTADGETI